MIKAAAIKVEGKIYQGNSHYDILSYNEKYRKQYFKRKEEEEKIKKKLKIMQDRLEELKNHREIEGFITDKGKFVDREEAAIIAYDCGQIKKITHRLESWQI